MTHSKDKLLSFDTVGSKNGGVQSCLNLVCQSLLIPQKRPNALSGMDRERERERGKLGEGKGEGEKLG